MLDLQQRLQPEETSVGAFQTSLVVGRLVGDEVKMAQISESFTTVILLAEDRQHVGGRPRSLAFVAGLHLAQLVDAPAHYNEVFHAFGYDGIYSFRVTEHPNAPVGRVLYLGKIPPQRICSVVAEVSQYLLLGARHTQGGEVKPVGSLVNQSSANLTLLSYLLRLKLNRVESRPLDEADGSAETALDEEKLR